MLNIKAFFFNYKICCICFVILLLSSCRSNEFTDPFWNIDICSDINNINEFLYKKSNSGDIVNCVFSFDKELYIKANDFDAKLNLSLEHPRIVNNEMTIYYTIVVEFKNEYEQKFNPEFFNYFVDLMESEFGMKDEEKTEKNTILLNWNTDLNIDLKVSVLKDINMYMVSIIKKN